MAEYETVAEHCSHCGSDYYPRKYRTNLFCSRSCANKARASRKERPCPQCNKAFLPPRNHGGQKYCSLACRDDARRTSRDVACSWCGCRVTRKASRADGNVYCSKDCERQWRAMHDPRGESHPQWKPRVVRPCGHCGAAVGRLPSQLKGVSFCSKACEASWRSEHLSGQASPTWRGGYDPYYGPNWRRQRRQILKGEPKCRRCGTPDDLHVHHIRPFRECVDYRKANRIDNLMVLCRTCHTTVEWEQRHAQAV